MNRTFKRNLTFGFGLSLLILLLSTIASYISINSLLNSSIQVTNTHSFIKELDNVIATLVDAETGQRGYLLTGEPVFLDPYRGANQKAASAMEKVKALMTEFPTQQDNYNKLESFISERLKILEDLISMKREGKPANLADLRSGKDRMDQVRVLVNTMQESAQTSLLSRTQKLNSFATNTRVLIVIASLLALMITIIFYIRVQTDFDERVKLQLEMTEKDRNISERIDMIHKIADKVSSGDYSIRINNKDKDTLGSLAGSLNKMAASLEHSFSLLSDREWLQTGTVELNEKMMGGTDLSKLCDIIIKYVAEYTHSQIGAIYIIEDDVMIKLYSSYGIPGNNSKKILALGEGITGQCAADGKMQLLENIDNESVVVSYSSGHIKPKSIIALPLSNEEVIKGVIELAKINPFSKRELAFLEVISQRIAGIINRLQNRIKMKELLEETQSQTEELQLQHSELQTLNVELEINTQKLQSSEEELRVQQEELLAANKELKERTCLLEEKNQMIQERNTEIQRKAEELALSTKYKSEFLANMSHELRTPLNSILLLSGLMISNTEKKLGEEHVEYAKVIQSSGNGLLNLIDEILDLSKIEAGKMQLDYEHISTDEIVRSMESLFKPFATQKEIEFLVSKEAEVPVTIETDRMRLEQILKNLLSNALKFTPVKGKVIFTVSNSADNHYMVFSVKDTGIGIATDKQALIFEAFQQEDGSTKRKFGGTGLGLSISRELVKLLNGKIELFSEVGTGSEFIAYVPIIAQDANGNETKLLPENAAQLSVTGSNQKIDQRDTGEILATPPCLIVQDDRGNIRPGDKLILIIEDDNTLAKVLLDFTRANGYKGLSAARGDEGLELAKKFKPTVVLLDVKLPGKNGWEVMEVLKNDPQTMHIPVHIMSSHNYKKESMLKGADDFIDKPLEFEKIISMFDKMDTNFGEGKKVLIIEEDSKHAKALAYFLVSSKINARITDELKDGIDLLLNEEVDCVILDKISIDDYDYEGLDEIRKTTGLESLPIIIFTSRSFSRNEELHLKKYVDTIIVRKAYSYQRVLDEVSLFLHVVEKEKKPFISDDRYNKLGILTEVLEYKNVLIADDDVRNIFSLTKALESYKVNVVAAMDGNEALKKLDENPDIDLILMDMMMPEMDGYDATIQLRKNPKYKNIPVIAVTAKAMMGDREKCIMAGASDYITKPVDIDQLLSLLRVWLYEKQHNKISLAENKVFV